MSKESLIEGPSMTATEVLERYKQGAIPTPEMVEATKRYQKSLDRVLEPMLNRIMERMKEQGFL